MIVDVGRPNLLWAAPFPEQKVLDCVSEER